ncbi:hypothetical protein ASV20_23030 [Enterobacter roggenkampii]|nr:hypothetical protein ASV20_23030 [Enterobacter roggenkampii]
MIIFKVQGEKILLFYRLKAFFYLKLKKSKEVNVVCSFTVHTLNTTRVVFNSCMLKIELLITTRLIFSQRNYDKFAILL